MLRKILFLFEMELLCCDVFNCGWIDGTGRQIRVLGVALEEIMALPEHELNGEMRELFHDLNSLYVRRTDISGVELVQYERYRKLFLDNEFEYQYPRVPVNNCIRPQQTESFIIHIILSMAEFDTEVDLFSCRTIRDVFRRGNLLLSGGLEPTELDVNHLMKRYVLEQLLFLPGGTKVFDNCLFAAHAALRGVIMDDVMPVDSMPGCLYTTLHWSAHQKYYGESYRLLTFILIV